MWWCICLWWHQVQEKDQQREKRKITWKTFGYFCFLCQNIQLEQAVTQNWLSLLLHINFVELLCQYLSELKVIARCRRHQNVKLGVLSLINLKRVTVESLPPNTVVWYDGYITSMQVMTALLPIYRCYKHMFDSLRGLFSVKKQGVSFILQHSIMKLAHKMSSIPCLP